MNVSPAQSTAACSWSTQTSCSYRPLKEITMQSFCSTLSSLCLTFSCSMFFLCCLIFFTSSGRSGIPFPASSSCSAAYSRQKTPVRPTPELRQTRVRLVRTSNDGGSADKIQLCISETGKHRRVVLVLFISLLELL